MVRTFPRFLLPMNPPLPPLRKIPDRAGPWGPLPRPPPPRPGSTAAPPRCCCRCPASDPSPPPPAPELSTSSCGRAPRWASPSPSLLPSVLPLWPPRASPRGQARLPASPWPPTAAASPPCSPLPPRLLPRFAPPGPPRPGCAHRARLFPFPLPPLRHLFTSLPPAAWLPHPLPLFGLSLGVRVPRPAPHLFSRCTSSALSEPGILVVMSCGYCSAVSIGFPPRPWCNSSVFLFMCRPESSNARSPWQGDRLDNVYFNWAECRKLTLQM